MSSPLPTIPRSKSQAEFAKASEIIPGGVNSPARAFGAVGGEPLVIQRGDGPYLYDIDGNRLIDFVGSWGPHILGHRHPKVIGAIEEALQYGTSFGAPTEIESELARVVVDAVDSVEMVRMVNSGTEATMSAIRAARGFTGRDKIVKFAGCYHGHVDSLLVKAGSGAMTLGQPSSPGIPSGCTSDTVVLEYNDPQGLEEAFAAQGDQIAAIILEAIGGNMGVVVAEPEFLAACRTLCDKHGALLIFDEVMTGFRVAYGGAQARLGIKPDMTTLGKIIGGGMPVGAYGGRKDVMQVVSPVGPVYQAGTLSGNPVAMACGLATLTELRDADPYPLLEQISESFVAGLKSEAEKHGIPHRINSVGSMVTLFFSDADVRDFSSASACDTARFAEYFWAMINQNVYLPCSQFEACFLSVKHAPDLIDHAVGAAGNYFAELASRI